MSDILHAITSRRATKHFDPSYRIEDITLMSILDAARHAPTAFNIQHCRFLVVQDREQRRRIRAAAWDQPQVEDCAALIVMCADIKAWEKDPARYWKDAPAPVRDGYVKMIHSYYDGREQVQHDEGVRSCGLAAYAIMMAAAAHGLHTCPMDGFDFDEVGRLINLPGDHEIVMFVALGREASSPSPRGGFLPLDAVVHRESFS
ncbi:nitroreductase family protein [Gluconobacter kanchanaburiensis]|uniref:Nitroreductase n=1 Tax=Gluconobacter kanchanaburiensis NBRC 103587 TaxID=1307948 RepID=A0A511B962_9PROT|nr:nitroreductase family protein [Gluconobacter kanchanaburiensis]MBF0862758.1 nitroreductase family protein [Gluconobacter kanchanaburiensis]GEK96985.1 nitroreductase [Gluconobacter kanchanaburiensis NBRC 103587]